VTFLTKNITFKLCLFQNELK